MRSSLFFNFVGFCAILLIFIGISASPRSQPLIAQVFELFFLLCALYFAIRWGSRRCAASSNGKASKKPSTVCIPSRRMKRSKRQLNGCQCWAFNYFLKTYLNNEVLSQGTIVPRAKCTSNVHEHSSKYSRQVNF